MPAENETVPAAAAGSASGRVGAGGVYSFPAERAGDDSGSGEVEADASSDVAGAMMDPVSAEEIASVTSCVFGVLSVPEEVVCPSLSFLEDVVSSCKSGVSLFIGASGTSLSI